MWSHLHQDTAHEQSCSFHLRGDPSLVWNQKDLFLINNFYKSLIPHRYSISQKPTLLQMPTFGVCFINQFLCHVGVRNMDLDIYHREIKVYKRNKRNKSLYWKLKKKKKPNFKHCVTPLYVLMKQVHSHVPSLSYVLQTEIQIHYYTSLQV